MLKRVALDTVTNQHGMSLLEFLHESIMSVVNDRITPNHDDFTFFSNMWKICVFFFVDYIIVPHAQLKNCICFSVKPCSDIVNQRNL